MVNPVGGTAIVLRPPKNFEQIYQGQPRTTPIPFVQADDNEQLLATDPLVGTPEIAANLARFVPLPIGSSVLILVPILRYQDGSSTRQPSYLYDFRWRLRTTNDFNQLVKQGMPEMPWSLVPTLGAPGPATPGTARRVLPAYTTEQVTPAVVGSAVAPLVAANAPGALSQGVYNIADFAGATSPTDEALGITYYPPYLRAIVGNEFSICASAATGNWNFTDTGLDGDAAFSNVYGTNSAGPQHPAYLGVGILLVVFSRSTTP